MEQSSFLERKSYSRNQKLISVFQTENVGTYGIIIKEYI